MSTLKGLIYTVCQTLRELDLQREKAKIQMQRHSRLPPEMLVRKYVKTPLNLTYNSADVCPYLFWKDFYGCSKSKKSNGTQPQKGLCEQVSFKLNCLLNLN